MRLLCPPARSACVCRRIKLQPSSVSTRPGATDGQLADQYDLARSTVIQLLKDHGASVRRPRVSPDETALAVDLHRQGMRQVDIASLLGRSKSMVWHLLRQAGEI